MTRGQNHKLLLIFLTLDLAVTAGGWVGAYVVRFSSGWVAAPLGVPAFTLCLRALPAILLLAAIAFYATGLYRFSRLKTAGQELGGVLRANGLLFLLLVTTTFYRRDPYESRLALGIFALANAVTLVVGRRLAWALVHQWRASGHNLSNAVIVGSGRVAQKLARALAENSWTGLRVVGFVDDGGRTQVGGVPLLGPIERLGQIVDDYQIAYVFVALPLDRYAELRRVTRQLQDRFVDLRLVPDVPHFPARTITVTELEGLPVVSLRENPHEGFNRAVKRLMDIVVSGTALLVLSPFMLLIAVLIKLTSPGPIFYRQERASVGGKKFQILKFRTMVVDAERHTGAVWAVPNDPRCTPIGRFLRRTSLDELPQLFNVLKGDMSIVGPRPERPVLIEKFRETIPNYMLRHAVKSGITGWAQVNGWRGNTSLRKRIQYDLYYITHWSIWLDLRIMILTLLRGMRHKNAY
jgi:Undecaprenyl-phosphate glucose phosphotransferase